MRKKKRRCTDHRGWFQTAGTSDPGLNGDNVVIVNNYYKEKKKGDEVVVFGGGLAGCECAIHLGMEGKKVRIVEMRDVLAPDANVKTQTTSSEKKSTNTRKFTGYKGLGVTKKVYGVRIKEGKRFWFPEAPSSVPWARNPEPTLWMSFVTARHMAVIGDQAGFHHHQCSILGLSRGAGYLISGREISDLYERTEKMFPNFFMGRRRHGNQCEGAYNGTAKGLSIRRFPH